MIGASDITATPEIGAILLIVTNLGSSIFRPVGGFSSAVLESDEDRLMLDSSRFFSKSSLVEPDLLPIYLGIGIEDTTFKLGMLRRNLSSVCKLASTPLSYFRGGVGDVLRVTTDTIISTGVSASISGTLHTPKTVTDCSLIGLRTIGAPKRLALPVLRVGLLPKPDAATLILLSANTALSLAMEENLSFNAVTELASLYVRVGRAEFPITYPRIATVRLLDMKCQQRNVHRSIECGPTPRPLIPINNETFCLDAAFEEIWHTSDLSIMNLFYPRTNIYPSENTICSVPHKNDKSAGVWFKLNTGNIVNKCDIYKIYLNQRPYHVEYTSSRPITEVKQRRA
ncbi:hypothetical protein AGLY_001350 [Aphis glycines]|uniref:Uncharacterized protein n=1 Tax=Aphis glycines TaxID=307491 RepID=A0A6G0U4W9_APHGL|nr:hypothetical protein AGLY_001350 [Aphis glycines]